jgi:hypothetical protein
MAQLFAGFVTSLQQGKKLICLILKVKTFDSGQLFSGFNQN